MAEAKQESTTNVEQGSHVPRHEYAQGIVKKYMFWSLGAGVLPFPLVDYAAVLGVHLQMVRKLAQYYEIDFSKQRAKSIIGTLISSSSAVAIKNGLLGGLLKAIPVAGQVLGATSMSIFSAATAYALGQVFIQHFEAGGTLLDFNPDKVRAYFAEQFEEGKMKASEIKSKKESK